MRKIDISSEQVINEIISKAKLYKDGWLDKRQFEDIIARIYIGHRCQTGDEIQEIVNNSFKAFLG
jgi:hypothetical protein